MDQRLIGGRGGVRAIWMFAATFSLCVASRAWAVDLIGYVPYYRMSGSYLSSTLPNQLPMLDEVRYFGLTVNSSGVIIPQNGSGTLEGHKSNINTLAQKIATLPANDRPRLDITLGGAGETVGFAAISADPALRATFAQNISTLLTQTGATSIDIDWESPANNSTQLNNYSLMLQRIKQEVGSNRGVYATIEPQLFMPPTALQGPNAIDGVSVMTYDLSWWSNGHDGHNGEHSLPEYVTDSFNAWTYPPGSANPRTYVFATFGNGMPASMLGIGMPFYGRGLNPNSGSDYTYAQLVAGGTTSDGNYYNYGGQQVWTLDPDLANQRVQFAHDHGLKNIIIWELGQDLVPTNVNSLLRTAFLKNQTLTGDYDGNGSVGPNDYDVWRTTFGAITGGDLRADGNGDGNVNAADYTIWRDHVSAGSGSGSLGSAIVPEPAAFNMLLIGCIVLILAFAVGHSSRYPNCSR